MKELKNTMNLKDVEYKLEYYRINEDNSLFLDFQYREDRSSIIFFTN